MKPQSPAANKLIDAIREAGGTLVRETEIELLEDLLKEFREDGAVETDGYMMEIKERLALVNNQPQ